MSREEELREWLGRDDAGADLIVFYGKKDDGN